MANEIWRLMVGAGVAALLLINGCGARPDRTTLQEGLRALDAGHYDQSISLFQQAVRENISREDNAFAYNGMGIAYERIKQKDNATRAFKNASRMDPGLVEPLYNLGVLQFASGKEAEAVVYFEKAALVDSREIRPLEFLAFIYQQRRQWDEARRVLAKAQSRAPRSPRVMTAVALLELQTNNVETAIALLQQALEYDDRYAPAVFNLAVVSQRGTNNPGRVRALFNDYLSLVPEGPQADKARQALKALPASVPVETVQPPVEAPSIEEWIKNARKLERAGRRTAAVNHYLKAAREAERMGNKKLKKQALQSAVVLCADDAQANYEVGLYYAEHKQNDRAILYLKKAVSQTNWFNAQVALATVAVAVQEFDTARVSVKQAARSKPDQADALWDLARLCDQQAALQDLAVPCYARFETTYPRDARAATARERIVVLGGSPVRRTGTTADAAGDTNRNTSVWWRNWFSK